MFVLFIWRSSSYCLLTKKLTIFKQQNFHQTLQQQHIHYSNKWLSIRLKSIDRKKKICIEIKILHKCVRILLWKCQKLSCQHNVNKLSIMFALLFSRFIYWRMTVPPIHVRCCYCHRFFAMQFVNVLYKNDVTKNIKNDKNCWIEFCINVIQ